MKRSLAFATLVVSIACSSSKPAEQSAPPAVAETPAASPGSEATQSPAAEPAAQAAPPPVVAPTPVVSFSGMALPETAYYDAKEDVYLVSNMNGGPADEDNNGFISKLAPDGAVVATKWIEGGKGKVKLDSPHGIAYSGDILFVSDLHKVRMFDRKGLPKGEIPVKGSSFLNGLTVGADGTVYVADTGITIADGKPQPTGTDAVYAIHPKTKKVTVLAKSTDLGGPNGLAFVDGKLWVVTYATGELYSLDSKGTKGDVQKLPKGGEDGIAVTPHGVYISSWELGGILKGTIGADFTPSLTPVESAADISFDSKRNRLVVPRIMQNTVEVYSVD